MRAEFFRPADGQDAMLAELQAALDGWVAEYNATRPHQSCGGRPPAERFRLADRSVIADDLAAAPPSPPAAPRLAAARRPPGVSRWVNAHGKISLAGFSCHAGAAYDGEPVEVVASGGLVGILHADVVVATCAQRMREDQADRAPRAPVARRARDGTAGLTVTRLADRAGVISFAGTDYQAGRRWARQLGPPGHRRDDRGRVGAAVKGRHGHPGPPDPARPGPRARRVRQPQRTTRRKNSAAGTVA